MADSKHPRHEEALSGVKASRAHLMIEAKARRKEKPQELATKKMQAVVKKKTTGAEPKTATPDFTTHTSVVHDLGIPRQIRQLMDVPEKDALQKRRSRSLTHPSEQEYATGRLFTN